MPTSITLMVGNMQKEILELVNDFTQWRGNSFTLATLVAELVKERAANAISEYPEAADIVRGL